MARSPKLGDEVRTANLRLETEAAAQPAVKASRRSKPPPPAAGSSLVEDLVVPSRKHRTRHKVPELGLDSPKDDLERAIRALEGAARLDSRRLKGVPLNSTARLRTEDVEQFEVLMTGPMVAYSAEEIRRFLVASAPERSSHLTRDYVARVLSPRLQHDRLIDRFGDEPRYLIAGHLAHHLLGAPVGLTEAEAVESFVAATPALLKVWPDFSAADLPRLRQIYPFIPGWPGGVKRLSDLSLERPYDNGTPIEVREQIDHLLSRVDELKKIPFFSSVLETANRIRGEEGSLAGTRYVDVTHALADKIPLLQSLIAHDGLTGRDIHWLAKHYAADPTVIDVMRRVFGVQAEEVPRRGRAQGTGKSADEAIERRAMVVLRGLLGDPRDRRPLLVHLGGIHLWQEVEAEARRNPDVPLACVSHTTSDGRDLLGEAGKVSYPAELLSMSEPKRIDEVDRFTHSLMFLLGLVEKQLDRHIRGRRFIIKGFGRIMGPAMAAALRAMRVDFAVQDPDPAAQAAARAAGYEVIPDMTQERHRHLVVLGCATGLAVTPEEIASLEHPAVFLQVQSGRDAFPMAWVEEKSRTKTGVIARQFVTHIEAQPTADYALDIDGRKITHTFVGDGHVANLGSPRPNNTELSILTSLLIEESLRQARYRLIELAAGDESQRGPHPVECVQIELTPGKPRRLVTFFPRSLHSLVMKPLSQVMLENPAIAAELDQRPDVPILFQAYEGAKRHGADRPRAPGSAPAVQEVNAMAGLPIPGTYTDAKGRRMTEDPSTPGAWALVPPRTKTAAFARAVVAHRFAQGRARYDGAVDAKAMDQLIALGTTEGLIERDERGKPLRLDRFLAELRPYQLDFVSEGADRLRRFLQAAGSTAQFFEIDARQLGGPWSDVAANRLLRERISQL